MGQVTGTWLVLVGLLVVVAHGLTVHRTPRRRQAIVPEGHGHTDTGSQHTSHGHHHQQQGLQDGGHNRNHPHNQPHDDGDTTTTTSKPRKHSHHKQHNGEHRPGKHHSVGESKQTLYKQEWQSLNLPVHNGTDACEQLSCRRREVCLLDEDTGSAQCVHKRVLRQKKKLRKILARKGMQEDDLVHHDAEYKNRVRKIKNDAKRYQKRYEQRMAGKLNHLKSAYDYTMPNTGGKKSEAHLQKHNSVLPDKPGRECTQRDMDEMGRRLLDWFKLLQDDDREHGGHHKVKRNSRKKELHSDDECLCQAPVSWEFQQLDEDFNGHLSDSELEDIENNGYEHCVGPFIESCDKDKDGALSEMEFCCCFANIGKRL